MKKVLAFDLGASSGRAILGMLCGGRITAEEVHRFENRPSEINGHMYWNILGLFESVKDGIRLCIQNGHTDIESIGIDTWGVDYGLLDADGELTGCVYHYRDPRTDGIEDYLEKTVGLEKLFMSSGIQNIWFNTSYQLAAAARDKRGAFDNARRLLLIPDLLGYFLTGACKNEYTAAVTTQLYDLRGSHWNSELMASLGIPSRLFGDIIYPGQQLGQLKPELAKELSAGPVPVLAVACHDTASAVCAIPALEEDFVFISCGTWSLFGTELPAPIISSEVYRAGFSNEGSATGKIKFLKNIMGLWIVQECRRCWRQYGEDISFAALEHLARESAPFKSWIDVEDSAFKNPDDMPAAIKDYCRRTGQYVPETKGEIIRCVVESLALKYRSSIDELTRITGKEYKTVHIVGGGVKNRLLCQFTANATGRPVVAGPVEGTAFGNIAVQLMANGGIASIAQARSIIRDSIELDEYAPLQTDEWERAYRRYLEII